MAKFLLALLGMVAVALAQESSSCKSPPPPASFPFGTVFFFLSIVVHAGTQVWRNSSSIRNEVASRGLTPSTLAFVQIETAPYYGPNGLVYPTLSVASSSLASNRTTTLVSSPTSSSAVVYPTTHLSNSTLSTSTKSRNSTTSHATTSHTATHSSTSTSASRTLSSIARETTASASAPAGTGAATANYPEAVGLIFGGLVAGWAVL